MANLWYSWLVTHGFAWFIVGHDILSVRVVKTGLPSNPYPPNVSNAKGMNMMFWVYHYYFFSYSRISGHTQVHYYTNMQLHVNYAQCINTLDIYTNTLIYEHIQLGYTQCTQNAIYIYPTSL